MSFFQKFLAKKNEPETLSRTLDRLKDAPPADIEALVQLENESTDMALRLALVPQLPFGAVLVALASSAKSTPELAKAARQRIAALLGNGELSRAELRQKIQDVDCLLAIAALSKDAELEAEVLHAIDDQDQLAALCLSASSALVRQTLAEKIHAVEHLKSLAKELKQRDKNAYKTIKSKLDIIRAQEAEQQLQQQKIAEFIAEAQQHQQRSFDKDYGLRFQRLERRWGELEAGATEQQKQQFSAALSACEQKIKEHEAEVQAEKLLEKKVAQAGSERQTLLDALWQLINDIYALESVDDQTLAELTQQRDQLQQQWHDLAALTKPASKEAKHYVLVVDAVNVLIREYSKGATLSQYCQRIAARELDDEAQGPDIKATKRLLYPIQSLGDYQASATVQEAHALLERIDSQYAAQKEQHQKHLRVVAGMVRRANQSIEQGHLNQAVGIRHSIDEKLALLDGVPSHISKQLEGLDEAIQKLIDWQAYAVVPKKEALISAMEQLVGVDEPPEALATKIKKLQDEWKALRQSGSDRHEELWEAFKALADKAYEPCKVYYDQLAELRKANLQKRQTLVAQLRDFYQQYDWDNADWKHVEKIVRGARSELHSYQPVERAANKAVMDSFDAVMNQLQEKISGEYQKNKTAKEQLISQAEKLVEMADIQLAIDAAKRLQNQWKSIGRAHFRDDEKLWKAFRAQCDRVFENKEKQAAERREEEDESIAKGRAIVDRMVALSSLDREQLLAARSEKDELPKQLDAVEGIPEKVARALQRDLSKSADEFDKKVAQALRANETASWDSFFTICEKFNQHLFNGVNNQSKMDSELETLAALTEQTVQWPEGVEPVIKHKLTQGKEICAGNIAENEKALRLLCIRSEILADKPTPAEDKGLRMEYQVKLLQKGLGLGQNNEDARAAIAKAWANVGPVSSEIYKKLYARLMDSWAVLPA